MPDFNDELNPEVDEVDCSFTNWCDTYRIDNNKRDDCRSAWYAAAGVVITKLEDELETALEFDNFAEADLLQALIERFQNDL